MKKMIVFLFFCLLCVWHNNVYGQNAPDLPQRTGTISATQSLHFGDLTIISGSAGGTVKVDYNGLRTSTGSVVLLNLGNTARQAIFEFEDVSSIKMRHPLFIQEKSKPANHY